MPYTLPRINLTSSQKNTLLAGVAVIVTAGYQSLQQLAAQPNAHAPAIVRALLPTAVLIGGYIVAALGRSLDKSRSGTGGGLVGSAPDTAAQATQGGLVQAIGENAPAASAAPPAGISSALVADVLPVLDQALSYAAQLELRASAAKSVSEQLAAKAEDAKTAEQTAQAMNRTALLAGIAAKADAVAIPVTAAEVPVSAPSEAVQVPAPVQAAAVPVVAVVPAIQPEGTAT